MAHFAQLNDDNEVTQVIVVANKDCGEPDAVFPETCQIGQEFIANVLQIPGKWRQTSYHASFRAKYAAIGDVYDETIDEFVSTVVNDLEGVA